MEDGSGVSVDNLDIKNGTSKASNNFFDRELRKVTMVPRKNGCLDLDENLENYEKDFLAFIFSMKVYMFTLNR